MGKSGSELRYTGLTGNLMNATMSAQNTVSVTDVALTTTATMAGHAIDLTYSPAGFADRDVTHFSIAHVRMKGVNQATQSWSACVALGNVFAVHWDDADCLGVNGTDGTTADTEAANTQTPYGVLISGTSYPGDYQIINSVFQSLNYGIYADGLTLEGLRLVNDVMLLVGHGIHWATGIPYQGRPGFVVQGTHFNVYTSAVETTGVSEVAIGPGNLFYHNESSTSAAQLVQVNAAAGGYISGNEFEAFVPPNTPTTTGIYVAGALGYATPASYLIQIDKNLFGAQSPHLQTGVQLASGASQVWLGSNYFGPNVGTGYVDGSGAGFGQQTAPNRHFVMAKLVALAGLSIPNNTDTPVTFDAAVYNTSGWTFAQPSASFTVAANQPFLFARCSAHVQWAPSAAGERYVEIRRNGSAFSGMPASFIATSPGGASLDQDAGAMAITPVAAGDVFTLHVLQTSGDALVLNPQFTWMSCEAVE
jgi:hypothetical protein